MFWVYVALAIIVYLVGAGFIAGGSANPALYAFWALLVFLSLLSALPPGAFARKAALFFLLAILGLVWLSVVAVPLPPGKGPLSRQVATLLLLLAVLWGLTFSRPGSVSFAALVVFALVLLAAFAWVTTQP